MQEKTLNMMFTDHQTCMGARAPTAWPAQEEEPEEPEDPDPDRLEKARESHLASLRVISPRTLSTRVCT